MKIAKLKLLNFLFLVLLFSACSTQNKSEIKSYMGAGISKEEFESYLKWDMEELNISGLSIAVINEGKVVHHRTMGYANREKKTPVTEETIFEGASMSKSVFAFFVMKYVEEGKLDLDRPLYEYLTYPDIEYDERYKKITARMVLSHRSGFPNWRRNEKDQKLRIKFEPGRGYEYSGEGYQYLAMVLMQIENTDWNGLEAAFQGKVARPLGLQHTVFIQTPYTRKHKAAPYNENGKLISNIEDKNEFGAGYSIHSESIDFSGWMTAVMNKEMLSEESYQELLRPHSEVSSGLADVFYALGFFTLELPFSDKVIYMHTGNNDGFTCWYALDTEKDWGFVVFTNSEYGVKLGEGLFLYLLTGLNFVELLTVAGVFFIIILTGIWFLTRFMIRKLKRKRAAANTPDKANGTPSLKDRDKVHIK